MSSDGIHEGGGEVGPVTGDDVAAIHEKLTVGEVVRRTDCGTHLCS